MDALSGKNEQNLGVSPRPSQQPRSCQRRWLGLRPYAEVWTLQQQLVAYRRQHLDADFADVVLLVEHPPVYTLGQGASLTFLKQDLVAAGYEVHRVERGGEVTYHCPGQLVVYPILNLRRYCQDLHWYMRQLEGVIIRAMAQFDLVGERLPGLTGVWLEGHKVAAIGIKASRWITMHGFAVNICPDLAGFERIVPCGLAQKSVGSLVQFCPELTFEAMRQAIIQSFTQELGVMWLPEAQASAEKTASLTVGDTGLLV
jgi:lipoyl(octanoyl) transferase